MVAVTNRPITNFFVDHARASVERTPFMHAIGWNPLVYNINLDLLVSTNSDDKSILSELEDDTFHGAPSLLVINTNYRTLIVITLIIMICSFQTEGFIQYLAALFGSTRRGGPTVGQ